VCGMDAAGVVVETSPSCSSFAVGDEVFYSGSTIRQGANAEFHVVDERIVGRKPRNLSFAEAAAMPLVSLTAWEALHEKMGIQPVGLGGTSAVVQPKQILIMGGGGGLGSTAIQLAKQVFGLTVIASASRPESAAYCRKMGADFVINHHNSMKDELAALQLDSGPHYVLDSNFSANVDQYLEVCEPLAKICSVARVDFMPGCVVDIGGGRFFDKGIQVLTELMFTKPIFGADLESQGHILNAVAGLLDGGQLRSTMTQRHDLTLDALIDAQLAIESGSTIGKIVLSRG